MVTHRGRWTVGVVLGLAGVLVLALDLLADPGRSQWWGVTVGLCLTGALVAQSARTRAPARDLARDPRRDPAGSATASTPS